MATVQIKVGGREFRRDVGSRLVIGRDMDCDVQVDDPKISRLHCLIERKGDDYVAVDLDSHNGTKISGWPLTRQTLKHGDVLDMGVASLQFLVEASGNTAEEAARLAALATDIRPEPTPLERYGMATRKKSLWEHAMNASEKSDPKSRKRKRLKPEKLKKQLFENKSALGIEEPIRIVRPAGSMPWYYKAIPLKLGVPASFALLGLIYVLANGMPSFNFGSTRNEPPKSLPHSSPHNND